METHDHVICRAPAVVGDRVAPIYMKQMKILHKAERFRPSYNIMKQRHDDDIVMANLIRDARCTSENQLDGHILRFREVALLVTHTHRTILEPIPGATLAP